MAHRSINQELAVPNIKSAIKRVEVAERNRVRNRSWKSAVRTVRNEVTDSVKVADVKKAGDALSQAYETIDKAVSKGILNKNSAARKKSKLARAVNTLTAGSAKK
jgi:small subunit ribosomal protein S20